jgi:hypothetical protein
MLVYVAAKYQAIQFAREIVVQLVKHGHIVISTWHTVVDAITTDREAEQRALQDLSEIIRCDVLVLLPENRSEVVKNRFAPVESVGRYVEVGIALATGCKVLIPDNHTPFIFSKLCKVYPTWKVKEITKCLKVKSLDS